jgi:hypothetical protein
MSILVSNPIASALSIYIMPRYVLLMLYSQMLYPYTVPLAMLVLTSLSLPTRRSSTLSPKAVTDCHMHVAATVSDQL